LLKQLKIIVFVILLVQVYMKLYIAEASVFIIVIMFMWFKEYVQFLNRLYDMTCFGAVYA